MRFVFLGFISVILLNILFAQVLMIKADASIPLSEQRKNGKSSNHSTPSGLSLEKEWQAFVQKNRNWPALWNEATQTPHQTHGPAIQIPEYSQITQQNVESAARYFLQTQQKALGIDLQQLKLIRATKVNNRWYVSYRQVVQGLEVLLSEVELRIFANGKVMAFGVDFYHDIKLPEQPILSYKIAKENAVKGLAFQSITDTVYGSAKQYILPVKKNRTIQYHLVYKAFVDMESTLQKYAVYVDAHTGQIIWRQNLVYQLDVNRDLHQTGLIGEATFGDIQKSASLELVLSHFLFSRF